MMVVGYFLLEAKIDEMSERQVKSQFLSLKSAGLAQTAVPAGATGSEEVEGKRGSSIPSSII